MDDMELKSKIQELREKRKAKYDDNTSNYPEFSEYSDNENNTQKKHDGVFGVVLFQSIIVVMIGIIYVLMQTFMMPQAGEIDKQLKSIIANDFSFKDALYQTVGDLLTDLNSISNVNQDPEVNTEYNGSGGEKASNDGIVIPKNITLASVIYTGSITCPVDDGRITSEFEFRSNPLNGEFEFHNALDIATLHGAPIYAAASGTVVESGTSSTLGKYIVIDHKNGFKTKYGHCSKLLVSEGTVIREGEIIAEIGSTGDSTGPHVHFAASKNGVYFNPQHLYKLEDSI